MGRPKGSGEYCPKPGEKFRAFEGSREARDQPTTCESVNSEVVGGPDSVGHERTFVRTMWSFKKEG
jgi:hypothetical protein